MQVHAILWHRSQSALSETICRIGLQKQPRIDHGLCIGVTQFCSPSTLASYSMPLGAQCSVCGERCVLIFVREALFVRGDFITLDVYEGYGDLLLRFAIVGHEDVVVDRDHPAIRRFDARDTPLAQVEKLTDGQERGGCAALDAIHGISPQVANAEFEEVGERARIGHANERATCPPTPQGSATSRAPIFLCQRI